MTSDTPTGPAVHLLQVWEQAVATTNSDAAALLASVLTNCTTLTVLAGPTGADINFGLPGGIGGAIDIQDGVSVSLMVKGLTYAAAEAALVLVLNDQRDPEDEPVTQAMGAPLAPGAGWLPEQPRPRLWADRDAITDSGMYRIGLHRIDVPLAYKVLAAAVTSTTPTV